MQRNSQLLGMSVHYMEKQPKLQTGMHDVLHERNEPMSLQVTTNCEGSPTALLQGFAALLLRPWEPATNSPPAPPLPFFWGRKPQTIRS